MKEKIKTQLRAYLGLKLRLCKAYMQEQDLIMAKIVLHQAIGAVEYTSVAHSAFIMMQTSPQKLTPCGTRTIRKRLKRRFFRG